MGIGLGTGENRATEAAKKAIASPLLENDIDGATDAIINISGGMDIALFEVDEALRTIRDASTTEINIIYGATINPDLGEDLIVTVIATGFDETNATAKPVEMLIGDNRNKKTPNTQAEQETPTTPEQPKPSQPKRQPFGGDNVEMIPNWLMNRYK